MKKWDKSKGKHPGGRPRKVLSLEGMEPENGVYFTVEEVVELLGLHRRTVQARLRDGTLKGKKLGGGWKIYRDQTIERRLRE